MPKLRQISKADLGSIYSAKGFCLMQAKTGHTKVPSGGVHLVQNMINCLRQIVLFTWGGVACGRGAAHGRVSTNHLILTPDDACPGSAASRSGFVEKLSAVASL